MNEHERWGLEVACDLRALFERSHRDSPVPLIDFVVGTAGPWLRTVYRLSDDFSGRGASASVRGLTIDMRVAREEFALVGDEPPAEMVWFGQIAEPQPEPTLTESTLIEQVWWRCIPPRSA